MGELDTKAGAFAEGVVSEAIQAECWAEILEQHSSWSEFRSLHKYHIMVWQLLTSATIALTSSGNVLGWVVDKRKLDSANKALDDQQIESNARSYADCFRGDRLVNIERHITAGDNSYSVAKFLTGSVAINHTDGSLIGYAPSVSGKKLELSNSSPVINKALDSAWLLLEKDLSRTFEKSELEEVRNTLHFSVESAYRDEAGVTFCSLRIWSYYSTFDLSMDAATEEVTGWYCEGLSDTESTDEPEIVEAHALDAANGYLTDFQGVQGPDVSKAATGDDGYLNVYWWHAENGINVEGDYVTVMVNNTTGLVFSVANKWRDVDIGRLLATSRVSESDVQSISDRSMGSTLGGYRAAKIVGKNIIQVSPEPLEPGPVTDRLVWRVNYKSKDGLKSVEISVDCETGEIARVTGW
jgi:hypothetical protein